MSTLKPPYSLYNRKFSDSNIITDQVTEQQINNFAQGVIDKNTRLKRIADLREKFGFKCHDNSAAWRKKLTRPQITTQKTNTLARLAHKAQLVTSFNNKLVGC